MNDGFDKSNIDFSELPELKPCPFCGNQFCAHEDHAFIETQGTKWGQVNCCNAEVRTGYGPLSEWIEDAIEAWNTRPVEDALRKRIEELKAEVNYKEEFDALCARYIELQRKYDVDMDKAESGYNTLMVKHIELENKYEALVEKLHTAANRWERGFQRNTVLHRNAIDCAYELRTLLEKNDERD